MRATRETTVWTVADVRQMHEAGRLELSPEFQRNSVWPHRAKAYFIDSLLRDRPVPVFIVERQTSAQTGKTRFTVIDGQQRLRAITEFFDDRFRLTQSEGAPWAGRRVSELAEMDRDRLLRYAIVVQQLEGYDDAEVRDIFVRLNRYVVRLAPQELRHARRPGEFATFVEALGDLEYWRENRVFTPTQIARMRPAEFAAELVILLLEGPQDKKAAVDLYYDFFAEEFPDQAEVEARLRSHLEWIREAVDLPRSRFRRAVDFYSLMGALDRVTSGNDGPPPKPSRATPMLEEFEELAKTDDPPRDVARYLTAASRQTDNITPRSTRIEVLERILRQA
jgi:hypothetical protein